jgi:hypothetical protein
MDSFEAHLMAPGHCAIAYVSETVARTFLRIVEVSL